MPVYRHKIIGFWDGLSLFCRGGFFFTPPHAPFLPLQPQHDNGVPPNDRIFYPMRAEPEVGTFVLEEQRPFMATIHFRFEDEQLAPLTIRDVEAGYSILEVTEDNDIHLNHNCGGVCACSTCHVYIESGDEFLEEISEKEEDFIDRAINPRLESRLGCQCIILDDDATIEVTIPDQSRIIGHEH